MNYLKSAGYILGMLAASAAMIGTAYADETAAGWFKNDSGKRFYKNTDGTLAVGTVEIDGIPYYFAPNGVQQLGWQTVNDLRYYYDPATGDPVFGWLNWRGENYYITKESGKQTSEMVSADGAASFDSYGAARHGWFQNENLQWNYKDEHGISLKNCQHTIDGIVYEFDENGALLTGWRTFGGITRYYDAETASAPTGWLTFNDEERYYVDAENGLLTGMQTIDGEQYCFDASGNMLTGLQTIGQNHYFFNDGGILLTGWFSRDDIKYHADETGALSSGSTEIDGKSYFFGSSGEMLTGIVRDGSDFVLYGEDGIRCTAGLQQYQNTVYGCDEKGVLLDGLQTIDGKRYFFTDEGTAKTGWETINGKKYYFDQTYAMQTGIQAIENKKYLFSDDGILLTGLNISGKTTYLSDENGELVTGWYTLNGAKYYCEADGIPVSGWKFVDSHTYYFDTASYQLAVSTTIDGFTINEKGIARNDNAIKTDTLVANAGKTPKAFFTYFTARYKYRRNESTRSYAQLTKAGWDTLITYMLKNKRGVCYYLAATFDYMCQRAGYTTRLVHATHDTGNHYWVQVYQNGAWHNYDPTYSSRNDISWSSQIALGNYTVLGFVKLKYDDRGALTDVTYTKYSG